MKNQFPLDSTILRRNPLSALLAVGGLSFALTIAGPAAQTAGKFELDATGTRSNRLGYFPVPVKLLDEKPAGVKKEPTYAGKPKYGVFKVGNGPKAEHYLALDEPVDGEWKIYVDLKGNGDLTSSGDGAWSKKSGPPRNMYGVNQYIVRASYGTAEREASAPDYGLAFYRFADRDVIFIYREAIRRGTVTIDGAQHKALLVENDADGLFAKPVGDDGKPVAGGTTRPVWLMIDMKDDGKWGPQLDVRGPIKLGGQNYLADIAPDGSTIKFAKTTREAPKPPERKELLAVGTTAPDFEAEAWGGGALRLSDFKGKVVLLDFWATWCGPCMKAMPHVEEIYQATKGQEIVVLGLCGWDGKEAYEKWMKEKEDTYHFKFAFDPAAKKNPESIAAAKYNVSGIPTTYIIDKDGKVAATTVGYEEGGGSIKKALGKLGIKVE